MAANSKQIEDVIKAITTDEHQGNSGSYVYDPSTGKRMPASQANIDEKVKDETKDFNIEEGEE